MNCNDMQNDIQPINGQQQILWSEVAKKAAITGAIAGVASYFLLDNGDISVMGRMMPSAVPVAAGVAAGSVAGDLAHIYVLPHIPQNQKYVALESAAVSVAAAGAGSYLGASMFERADPFIMVALGAGAYVTGDYIQHEMLKPSMLW